MSAPPPASLPLIPMRVGNPCFDNGCTACCHDIEMVLTNDDVERLRAARPKVDFFFQADDGYLQLRTNASLDRSKEQGHKPSACVFLGANGACSVHEVRPEGCRLYPAVWDSDVRAAALDTTYCPHTDGFRLAPATADALRRLAGRLESERMDRTSV